MSYKTGSANEPTKALPLINYSKHNHRDLLSVYQEMENIKDLMSKAKSVGDDLSVIGLRIVLKECDDVYQSMGGDKAFQNLYDASMKKMRDEANRLEEERKRSLQFTA